MAQEPGELNNTKITGNMPDLDATNSVENEIYAGNRADSSGIENQTNDTPGIAEEPGEIRRQIEDTRSSMSETIDAIGEKLSFANISEQVKEQVSGQMDAVIETVKENVYDATVGKAQNLMKSAGDLAGGAIKSASKIMEKTGRNISDTEVLKMITNNPLPLALIGLGVGLLIFKNQKGRKNTAHFDAKNGNMRDGKNQKSEPQSHASTLDSAQQKIGDAAGGAVDAVSGAASSAYESAGDYAGQAYKSVGKYGSQALEKSGDLARENPLVIGAVAATIGAAIAMAIPASEYENNWMGETRENLMQKAQDSTGDLVGKVKDFVTDAGLKIGDQVKEQVAAK